MAVPSQPLIASFLLFSIPLLNNLQRTLESSQVLPTLELLLSRTQHYSKVGIERVVSKPNKNCSNAGLFGSGTFTFAHYIFGCYTFESYNFGSFNFQTLQLPEVKSSGSFTFGILHLRKLHLQMFHLWNITPSGHYNFAKLHLPQFLKTIRLKVKIPKM